jgi:hypothetical protein
MHTEGKIVYILNLKPLRKLFKQSLTAFEEMSEPKSKRYFLL